MGHHQRNFGGRNNGIPAGGIDLSAITPERQQAQANQIVIAFAEKIYLDLVGKLPLLPEGQKADKEFMRNVARTALEYAVFFPEAIGLISIPDLPEEPPTSEIQLP